MKPKKIGKLLFKIAIAGAIFVSGWIFAKFLNISNFTVGADVSLVDIASLCVTIFAAWYISSILETEKQDQRTQKDLIIQRTEDIYRLIDESSIKVVSDNVQLHTITSHLKRINVSITTIEKLLLKTKLTIDSSIIVLVRTNTRTLRDLTTSTPTNVASNNNTTISPISIVAGIVMLSPSRKSEIEVEYDKLKDNILLLQIEINKA